MAKGALQLEHCGAVVLDEVDILLGAPLCSTAPHLRCASVPRSLDAIRMGLRAGQRLIRATDFLSVSNADCQRLVHRRRSFGIWRAATGAPSICACLDTFRAGHGNGARASLPAADAARVPWHGARHRSPPAPASYGCSRTSHARAMLTWRHDDSRAQRHALAECSQLELSHDGLFSLSASFNLLLRARRPGGRARRLFGRDRHQ
jgi:hypothetical protein